MAIFGAGPVGLLCASCARLNGAEQIFIIDHNDYRLDFAQQRYGAIPINFDHHDDPAQWIIDNTPGPSRRRRGDRRRGLRGER
ncbi:hypothetical protein LNO89_04925 [Klebsiella pneumoniae subsp. pneumoniae]|nr:hypothetical protein [Klebsiella pneumoniae subsp. pneumoniae]